MSGNHETRAGLPGWIVLGDLSTWVTSLVLFSALRLAAAGAAEIDLTRALAVGVGCGVLHVVLGFAAHLYRGRAGLGSFEEALILAGVTLATGAALVLVSVLVLEPWLPRSVPVAATCSTLVGAAALRAVVRRRHELAQERDSRWKATPALILGAGSMARSVITSMLSSAESPWRPVGMLSDDPSLQNLRVRGVPVLGGLNDLARVARETGARCVVVAPDSSTEALLPGWADDVARLGLELKVLPHLADLPTPQATFRDLRDIAVQDLLGRHIIDTDISSIAGYLEGRRVLVTGAGGSIGAELCRQISTFAPAELVMLDRDESALHAVQLSLEGRALLDSPDVILADLRDRATIRRIFAERRPEVVFHAAALKHLPMLEQYPAESVQTNVWGTLTVLEAAVEAGVERFVNISTDKAADPICALGYSKRLAERLTAGVPADARGTYQSVRFGNVLGSRGSVLTTFVSQIQGGGPVTVTDPEVTRYFMTIAEAVQLVIQAAAIGGPGEVLVLDMGRPVRIQDVAHQLMTMLGRTVPIEYTGLRAGEKLHEDLLAADEADLRPGHPLVTQTPAPPLAWATAQTLDIHAPADRVIAQMARMCGEPGPDEDDRPTGSRTLDAVGGSLLGA